MDGNAGRNSDVEPEASRMFISVLRTSGRRHVVGCSLDGSGRVTWSSADGWPGSLFLQVASLLAFQRDEWHRYAAVVIDRGPQGPQDRPERDGEDVYVWADTLAELDELLGRYGVSTDLLTADQRQLIADEVE